MHTDAMETSTPEQAIGVEVCQQKEDEYWESGMSESPPRKMEKSNCSQQKHKKVEEKQKQIVKTGNNYEILRKMEGDANQPIKKKKLGKGARKRTGK